MRVKDEDNLTDKEKHAVWKKRWRGPVVMKPVSRKRTEKELMDDDRAWRP